MDVDKRIQILKKLKSVILNNENKISEALKLDLNKSEFESFLTEINPLISEIDYNLKNIKKWSRPFFYSRNWSFLFSKDYIICEPKGKILIISPWNYPFYLAISPLISAIASGNKCVLKPSEYSENTSKIIFELILENFPKEIVSVKCGGEKVVNKLFKDEKFNHIFFTGSTEVGKIIYKKASEKLIPVTLELGGKSPLIVDDKNIHKKFSLNRIIWGKLLNSGQTCIAPDYMLIRKSVFNLLKDDLILKSKEFYKNYSEDYPRIINKKHFLRLKKMILENSDKIISGGGFDDEKLIVEPTLILNPKLDSSIMKNEIFGPILPIFTYKNLDDAISIINKKEKPLAIYLFSTNKKVHKKIINETSSGGVCVNDTIIQISSKKNPFGGVGSSGIGRSHGRYGFLEFSNQKSVTKNTFLLDVVLRYPPFTVKKFRIYKFFSRFL